MAGAPLAIEITARLDKFRTEMAKIPDIGGKEAKALTAQLSKEIKAATKAAEDAARSAKGGKAGFAALGDAAGKAGSNTMKLAGAASMVTPALGEMTRNAGDAFDVLEVLGTLPGPLAAGLGALTVVLGTGALAWKVYNADAQETARISAEVRDAQAQLAPILDATRQASIDLDEATGKLNETQAQQARDQLAAWSQLQAATSETRKKIQGLQADQQSFGTVAVDTLESIIPAWTPFGYILRKTTTDSEDLRVEMDALGGVIADGQEKTRALVEIQTKAAAATKTHETAVRADADAERGRVAALAAAEAEIDRQADATRRLADQIRDLQAVSTEAANERLTGEDAVTAKLETKLAVLRAERDLIVETAASESQQAAAREAYVDAEVELTANAQAEITRLHEEESAKRGEIAEKEAAHAADVQRQSATAAADIAGSTADALGAIRANLTKDQKDAAMALFAAQKAAGIAEATLNTGVAVSNALATPGVPYPVAVAFAVAAGIAGAANIASVASTPAPTFSDTPGPVMAGNGVGRTSVNVSAGDMVVASRTRDGLRAQVDPYARRTDGANVTVINRRTFGATVRDDVRVNSPLARLSATSPTALGFR